MTSWSDLPTELRVMVFHRIFYQTCFCYSNPKKSFGRQTTNQVLDLMLVSKSFARGDDVVTAMASEAILWLEYDEHMTGIIESPKYGNHLLTRLRKLELDDPSGIRLSQFESLFPNLRHIHVYPITIALNSPPQMYVPCDTRLLALLRAEEGSVTGDCMVSMKTSPRSDILFKEPAHFGLLSLEANRAVKQKQFLLKSEYEHGLIEQEEVEKAISHNLSGEKHYVTGEPRAPVLASAKWLVQMLADSVKQKSKIEVTTSWVLKIFGDNFNITGGVEEYAHYYVEPVFLSSRDMCMRFYLDGTEVVIPQRFDLDLFVWDQPEELEQSP